ncbi:MAG: prepilin peptidase [Pseudomonadota bacterium]
MSSAAPVWGVAIVVLWVGVASWLDWRNRRLPNVLMALGVAGAAMWQLLAGVGPLGVGIPESLSATLLGLLLLLPPYLVGWLGGGDVKFLGALGYLGGVFALLGTLVLGALLQLIAAAVLAIGWGRPSGRPQPLALTHGPVFVGIVAWRYFS